MCQNLSLGNSCGHLSECNTTGRPMQRCYIRIDDQNYRMSPEEEHDEIQFDPNQFTIL